MRSGVLGSLLRTGTASLKPQGGGGAALTVVRYYFNDAGTPPGGVTKNTTANSWPGASIGWDGSPGAGFIDRGTGAAGTSNPWFYRGNALLFTDVSNCYWVMPCPVGGTIAVRAYCYDPFVPGTVSMSQVIVGNASYQTVASAVMNASGVSAAICEAVYTDVNNVGYIKIRAHTPSAYGPMNGVDYVVGGLLANLPTAWAFP